MFDLRDMARERVLVAAHRGTWMGNIPCNTIMAFNTALAEGADIIELDISRSQNGTLYVFHPGREKEYMHSEKLIADMKDDEIRSLRLFNTDGAETQYPVPLFDDILEALKGRCVINIDKFPRYPQEIVNTVRRHGMVDQALVKTKQDPRCYDMMEELAPDFAYMTFAMESDHDSEQLVHRSLNYLGTEAIFANESSELASISYQEKMHSLGLLTWVNSIVYDYKAVLSAGHTDDLFALGRADDGWGYLASLGFNIIQTDWVSHCLQYLKEHDWR